METGLGWNPDKTQFLLITLGGRKKSRLVYLSGTSDMFLAFNLKITLTSFFRFTYRLILNILIFMKRDFLI